MEMKLDYSMVGRIQNFQAAHPQVMQKEAVYEEAVRFCFLLPLSDWESLCKELTELTEGKASFTEGEESVELVEV